MARPASDDDHLPNGIVPLPRQDAPEEKAGCGVRGCLYGTMALFALLLTAMVLIALFRAWPRPAVLP
jgi:hypothetical protein